MSIQNAIAIARSGLYAQQLAIQVASQNIANAQTQGYTRQTLVISPTYPQSTPIGILGTGVRADITRQRDKFVDETYRREAGRNASYTARSDILGQIETVYGEPSDSGLSATMDAFWSSWGDLSNEPTSAPAKAMVRQRAEDVATAINGISGRITSGSRMPDLLTTKRDWMPEALTMNSLEECASGCTVPAAIASALRALKLSTYWLNATTSSSLLMDSAGVNRPVPVMATRFMKCRPEGWKSE